MFSNQIVSYGRGIRMAIGLATALMVSGCSLFHSSQPVTSAPAAAPVPVATAAEAAPAEGPQTVTEALGDLQEGETAAVIADTGNLLNASAPRNYVIKRGDTLWGLANMFLRDPFTWPEIWYLNPQVQNPHLIYPGDTLALAQGSDGRQQLQLTRGPAARLQPLLRSTSLGDDGPIATIPYEAIRAFLSRPGILTKNEAKATPYVLSIRDHHLIAGADHDLYVKKLNGALGERHNIMHVDVPLRDPDGNDLLGYMAIYSGTSEVTRAGEPALVRVRSSAREILAGDVLVPEAVDEARNIVPRAPGRQIDGQVMAVVNGVLLVGQYQIVAVNRGSSHGLEVGHVLQASERGQSVRDRCVRINGSGTCNKFRGEQLPEELAGKLLVFKTFDRMSYALVVTEIGPIHIGDRVSNP